MNIYQYLLLAYLAISALYCVATVNRPRLAVTPSDAVITLVFLGGLATLVVLA